MGSTRFSLLTRQGDFDTNVPPPLIASGILAPLRGSPLLRRTWQLPNMAETEKTVEKSKPPLACAKCGHSNKAGRNHCEQCGSRLYITCHNCGHSTARVAAKCGFCGHRLHHSVWSRVRRRIFGRNPKITPFQVALLVAFVLIAYKVLIYIAEYRAPTYVGE